MVMAVWDGWDKAMKTHDSVEVWGRIFLQGRGGGSFSDVQGTQQLYHLQKTYNKGLYLKSI